MLNIIVLPCTVTAGTYKWTDATDVDYTYWAPGQPDREKEDHECVELNTQVSQYKSMWNSQNCNELRSFGCKLRKGETNL